MPIAGRVAMASRCQLSGSCDGSSKHKFFGICVGGVIRLFMANSTVE